MIIPIGDDNPHEKIPVVTYSLIGINTIVYIYFGWIRGNYPEFVTQFGFIPGQFHILTVFTSMFLHGDILHLAGNMLFLWIYGDNVEAKFGKVRFLLFYLASGVIGHALQTVFSTNLQLPNIGASGAIAGILGAYLVLFPKANINFWYFFFFYFRFYSGKFKLPAWLVLGGWFTLQLLSGYFGLTAKMEYAGGIAFFAHIGGFLCGLGVMLLFREIYRFQRARLLNPAIDDMQQNRFSYDSEQRKGIRGYQKAVKEVLLKQGTGEAVPLYEQFQSQYPDSAVDAETAFQLAESYCRRKEFEKALKTYKKMLVHYPHSEKADNALWCMAEVYRMHYNLLGKADQCLQIILDGYPLSEWYSPAKLVFEQEGKTVSATPRLQTITKLGFAGRQLQFTGPVLVGLIVSLGSMSWMSATLPHKTTRFIEPKSAITEMTETEKPVWSDNFDSEGLNQWNISYPEDKLVKIDTEKYVSAPNSVRFWREQKPKGIINPGEIISEKIPVSFTEPYTLSFDMFYTGIMLVQKIEFGHISIEFQIVRLPMVGISAQVRYKFGNDVRPIRLKEKPFGRFFPANQWNHLDFTLTPLQKTLTININGKEWTTVALDLPNIEPKQKFRFNTNLVAETKRESDKTLVYLDNIKVHGQKSIVLPEKPTAKPVMQNLEYTNIYQQGWNQFRNGEYYSSLS
ncbi:MAG: rhomboid family intramembrane serine protease, partial [bacterium]|nr:rhomboid family intramembrane serine protease [bacterium]